MSNKSFKKSHKMGLWKVSALIVLSILMLSSGLMIAKLNANVGVATASVGVQSSSVDIGGSAGIGGGAENGIGGETDINTDYSYLANKYYSYFVQNPNGTAYLDLGMSSLSGLGITSNVQIEPADRDGLIEYGKFLDNLNQQVANGDVYIGDDHNYYFTQIDKNENSRTLKGGRNNYYIRSERFWFIWLPVGHHIEMSTEVAVFFGVITGVLAIGSNILAGGVKSLKTWIKEIAAVDLELVNDVFLEDFLYDLVDVALTVMTVKGIVEGIKAICDASFLVVFIDAIATLFINLVWGSVGFPMLKLGAGIITPNSISNTVVVEPDLIFVSSTSWTYRY